MEGFRKIRCSIFDRHNIFSLLLLHHLSGLFMLVWSTLLLMTATWLRVIQINDVYELDALPHLKTLVEEQKRNGPDRCLVVLCGDFLAPSLQSSLDHGRAMMDCLEACGVTHVCLGNHETDVSMKELKARIQQSSSIRWINSNLRELDEILGVETLEYEIIEVGDRKVGLLGLLTNDPSLYRPSSFGGATIEPVMDATLRLLPQMPPFVLPLTHQSIQEDREFARAFPQFPLVLGGHEHILYDERVGASRILKTGCDAHTAAIIDLRWEGDSENCDIQVEMVPTANYAPDPDLLQRVYGHQTVVRQLEQARLWTVNDFSTKNNRLGPSTGTQQLTSLLRQGMRCECALLNAGSVRANKDYPPGANFTYKDLKAEIPFPTTMIACEIPGHILSDTVCHSRAGARQGEERGGYLHTSRNVVCNDKDEIVSIAGKPLDPDRLYLTAVPYQFFQGIDNHEPLLKWAAEAKPSLNDETSVPAKQLVVEVCSAQIWLQLGSFDEIDFNQDGVLTRDEIQARVEHVVGQTVTDLIVDQILAVGDINGDGTVTPLEMMLVQCTATDMMDHICTNEERAVMKEIVLDVLGDGSPDEIQEMVSKMQAMLDKGGDGKIDRTEFRQALGALKRQDLHR